MGDTDRQGVNNKEEGVDFIETSLGKLDSVKWNAFAYKCTSTLMGRKCRVLKVSLSNLEGWTKNQQWKADDGHTYIKN